MVKEFPADFADITQIFLCDSLRNLRETFLGNILLILKLNQEQTVETVEISEKVLLPLTGSQGLIFTPADCKSVVKLCPC